ncbi:MAG TPA: DUF1697 domain-containing protein [Thermomicrobiales bacterium]|nr:DUF1697 domain-containing protein [Thermomicrobiales bacterium]
MATYVALLRGINVGGNKRIAMAALRELVEGLGYGNVQTYVNSGNVVFTTAMSPNGDIARNIHEAIRRQLGMDVAIIVRTDEEVRRVVAGNPFPERVEEPKTLHVTFLAETPDPDEVAKLADLPRGDDDYRVIGDVVYLSYPNKMTGAVFLPKLSVPQTNRNWTTVMKLAEMATSTAAASS